MEAMEYDHTQFGYTGALTTVFMAAVTWTTLRSVAEEEESAWVGLLMLVFAITIVAITFWFSKLAVTVADGRVTTTFGLGKPHRAIPLSDVIGVHEVRNSWIQGWGIRKVTNGWMYNVWGLDAVKLELTSGDVFQIGTDDPEGLSTAITLSLPG
jgi:hypothetical protein